MKCLCTGIPCCCNIVNVHNHPPWATSRKEVMDCYSSRLSLYSMVSSSDCQCVHGNSPGFNPEGLERGGPCQRHILKERRPITTTCPVPILQGDGGQMNWNSVRWGKKYFGTGPTRAARAWQRSLELARQAQQIKQWRTPFICIICIICTLWVPIYLSFNSQQSMIDTLISLRIISTYSYL